MHLKFVVVVLGAERNYIIFSSKYFILFLGLLCITEDNYRQTVIIIIIIIIIIIMVQMYKYKTLYMAYITRFHNRTASTPCTSGTWMVSGIQLYVPNVTVITNNNHNHSSTM
jgi:hypothetical protein